VYQLTLVSVDPAEYQRGKLMMGMGMGTRRPKTQRLSHFFVWEALRGPKTARWNQPPTCLRAAWMLSPGWTTYEFASVTG
jgi:hypothetical protein